MAKVMASRYRMVVNKGTEKEPQFARLKLAPGDKVPKELDKDEVEALTKAKLIVDESLLTEGDHLRKSAYTVLEEKEKEVEDEEVAKVKEAGAAAQPTSTTTQPHKGGKS